MKIYFVLILTLLLALSATNVTAQSTTAYERIDLSAPNQPLDSLSRVAEQGRNRLVKPGPPREVINFRGHTGPNVPVKKNNRGQQEGGKFHLILLSMRMNRVRLSGRNGIAARNALIRLVSVVSRNPIGPSFLSCMSRRKFLCLNGASKGLCACRARC